MHTIGEKTEARRRRLPVTMLVPVRWTTWAFALWSGYMAAWAAASGAGSAIVVLWWLSGLALLQAIAHSAARLPATSDDLAETSERGDDGAVWHLREAVQGWESEGGAIAEPLPAPRTPRVA